MIVNYPRMRRKATLPIDLRFAIQFSSEESFSISTTKHWDGKIEYRNSDTWEEWDGSQVFAGESETGYSIYFRGTGNSVITGSGSSTTKPWNISGTNVKCDGNIENLLDYKTVRGGGHPTMGSYCYADMFKSCNCLTKAPSLLAIALSDFCYNSMFSRCASLAEAPSLPATSLRHYCYTYMFYGCSSLIKPPSLPATFLRSHCYHSMFGNCINLMALPRLPATTLSEQCYLAMFYGCTKIKISTSATEIYNKKYRIPFSKTGATATDALSSMFEGTGGTFAGTPTINTTYYLDESNEIV